MALTTPAIDEASESADAAPHRPIPVRRLDFDFAEDLPRYWLGGHRVGTLLADGINLLFPLAERFFIRSVRRYAGEIADPILRERVASFIGQEARHGFEHERFFAALQRQGYDVPTFLRWYEAWSYRRIEPLLGPRLSLAVTAALEHFAAMFGDNALRDEAMDAAHPDVRRLLLWHSAEEIEHKSVAFDVLRFVDDRYATRATGMIIGASALAAFWVASFGFLLWQDRRLPRAAPTTKAETSAPAGGRWRLLLTHSVWPRAARAFADYFRPGFHPDQNDNYHLAEAYLADLQRWQAQRPPPDG